MLCPLTPPLLTPLLSSDVPNMGARMMLFAPKASVTTTALWEALTWQTSYVATTMSEPSVESTISSADIVAQY